MTLTFPHTWSFLGRNSRKKHPVQGINTNIHILTSVDKKTLMTKPGKAYTLTAVVKSISLRWLAEFLIHHHHPPPTPPPMGQLSLRQYGCCLLAHHMRLIETGSTYIYEMKRLSQNVAFKLKGIRAFQVLVWPHLLKTWPLAAQERDDSDNNCLINSFHFLSPVLAVLI